MKDLVLAVFFLLIFIPIMALWVVVQMNPMVIAGIFMFPVLIWFLFVMKVSIK